MENKFSVEGEFLKLKEDTYVSNFHNWGYCVYLGKTTQGQLGSQLRQSMDPPQIFQRELRDIRDNKNLYKECAITFVLWHLGSAISAIMATANNAYEDHIPKDWFKIDKSLMSTFLFNQEDVRRGLDELDIEDKLDFISKVLEFYSFGNSKYNFSFANEIGEGIYIYAEEEFNISSKKGTNKVPIKIFGERVCLELILAKLFCCELFDLVDVRKLNDYVLDLNRFCNKIINRTTETTPRISGDFSYGFSAYCDHVDSNKPGMLGSFDK